MSPISRLFSKAKKLLVTLLFFILSIDLYSHSSKKLSFKDVKAIKIKTHIGKISIKQNKEKNNTEITHLLKSFSQKNCSFLIEKSHHGILTINNESKFESWENCEIELNITTVEKIEIEIISHQSETELFGIYEKVKVNHKEGHVFVSGKIEFAHFESKHGNININNSQIYSLYMKSQTGSINAYGNFKKVRSTNKLGDTEIHGVNGDCKADSRSGKLKIIGHIDTLTAKSQNGDIYASGLTQNSLLSSRSGNIKAYYKSPPNEGKFLAHSKTGEISLHLPSQSEFRLMTQKENIKTMDFEKTNPNHSFYIKAKSRHGEVHIRKIKTDITKNNS